MEAVDWVSLGDEELLERRISTRGLKVEGTALEPLIKQPDIGDVIPLARAHGRTQF